MLLEHYCFFFSTIEANYMDKLTGMAVFAKVAERQNFTAAARDLGLSKSAVSKQIQRLEDRLGVRLLNRTTRRLHLTESGQAFFERARRVVEEAEEAELAVTRLHDEPRGTLRINAPMTFGVRHLSPCLPDFIAQHPELSIDIAFNDRQVDLIEEGFDVGIRIAELSDSTLIARKLSPCRLAVIASPDYWGRHGRPSHPSDLKNHDCLMYQQRLNPGEWVFKEPGATGAQFSVPVNGRIAADNGDGLLEMARAGVGVYQCPTFMSGRWVVDGQLEMVLQEYETSRISVYAIWPHNRHLSAKVRTFVDFLVERFGPQPYWDCAGIA
jgi:DNA-binding transcriptional LysR family regulator